jgi:predicted TIM-barrel fold metal-dependent hydrolase
MTKDAPSNMLPVVDVNAFIGAYPFRHVPHPDPDVLVRVMDREQIESAWVGHLPSAFHRDPTQGNAELLAALSPYAARLRYVPTVRPDWPSAVAGLAPLRDAGAVAVRLYPQHAGLAPGDHSMRDLALACGALRLPIILTVKFEDVRQRHSIDGAVELTPAHVRELARQHTGAGIVVTAAGREFIEEVHWGLTPDERSFVQYDMSWLWGPPTGDFSHVLRTIGGEHVLFGTMWPLRLTQLARANLELRDEDVRDAMLGVPGANIVNRHAG